MNILVLTSSYPKTESDSSSPYVKELYEHIARIGHTVHVVLPHFPGGKHYEVRHGVHLHFFRYFTERYETLCYGSGIPERIKRSWKYRIMFLFFFGCQLLTAYKVMRRYKTEVISAHWLLSAFSGIILKLLSKQPIILTIYGVEIFLSKRSGYLRRLCRLLFGSISSIITISRSNVHMFRRLWGCSIRLRLIPVGPQTDIFSPEVNLHRMKRPKPMSVGSSLSLLFVGRLVERKGVIYLIRALDKIQETIPNAKLVIVGDGPEHSHLQAEAERLKKDECINFYGFIGSSQLARVYEQAHIFILPSIIDSSGDTEGLGAVTFEAWVYGLPVIASHVGGITDTVIHKQTGLSVEPNNSDAIADAVIELVNYPKLVDFLVQNGQALLKTRYSWSHIADSYTMEFQHLLDRV